MCVRDRARACVDRPRRKHWTLVGHFSKISTGLGLSEMNRPSVVVPRQGLSESFEGVNEGGDVGANGDIEMGTGLVPLSWEKGLRIGHRGGMECRRKLFVISP